MIFKGHLRPLGVLIAANPRLVDIERTTKTVEVEGRLRGSTQRPIGARIGNGTIEAAERLAIRCTTLRCVRQRGIRQVEADIPPCIQHLVVEVPDLPSKVAEGRNLAACGIRPGAHWRSSYRYCSQDGDGVLHGGQVTGSSKVWANVRS